MTLAPLRHLDPPLQIKTDPSENKTHLEDSLAGAVCMVAQSPRQLLPQMRLCLAITRVPAPEVRHSTTCYSRHRPNGSRIVELSDP